MNLSEKLEALEDVTGFPVAPDIYEGEEDKYITYVYEDERVALAADNGSKIDRANITVNFFCPTGYNYYDTKHQIRDYLEQQGFVVTMRTWVEPTLTGTGKIRRVLFETEYAEGRV